jgi:serine/threonine-protein kinase RsbW
MRITLSLMLPRDEMSIPVARHIVKAALENVGVEEECVHDVEVALSEACGNVLRHSGPGDEYEVNVELEGETSTIRVIDTGRGFDFATLGKGQAEPSAEQGRGVNLMHALVDRVKFISKPEAGTVVHLEKDLRSAEGSLLSKAVAAHDAPSSA